MISKKELEGLADAGPLAIQFGNIFCKVLHRAGNVALAHAVVTVNMVPFLAVVRKP
jgi:hypothetical protein